MVLLPPRPIHTPRNIPPGYLPRRRILPIPYPTYPLQSPGPGTQPIQYVHVRRRRDETNISSLCFSTKCPGVPYFLRSLALITWEGGCAAKLSNDSALFSHESRCSQYPKEVTSGMRFLSDIYLLFIYHPGCFGKKTGLGAELL